MRIGMGYDVHRLVEDRPLILGGVVIPYEKGLLGHSDADVLLHAVMDALLGAAALGDIGKHFPDTDEQYRGISSLELLKRVGVMLDEQCMVIENIDATVIAQRPKLLPYMEQMKQNIADALHLEPGRVNVKATTEEGLGFTGNGEGISAQAVCLLQPLMDGIADERMMGASMGTGSVPVAGSVAGACGMNGAEGMTDAGRMSGADGMTDVGRMNGVGGAPGCAGCSGCVWRNSK